MSSESDNLFATVGSAPDAVSGAFVEMAGERFYVIRNVDRMPPFFMSVVSGADHWLFVSSTGGLTAGRVSPDTALFPYVPVDRIHESALHTGCRSVLRVRAGGRQADWEPFNREQDFRYRLSRNLYKNVLGSRLCFEEINHDLELVFRYCWSTSDDFGFVRDCAIHNIGSRAANIEIVDGLLNILPAGTPRSTQTTASNLVDAYKWTEVDERSGLALYTVYSGISDRAEPSESLTANTVFCIGLPERTTLISARDFERFRRGEAVEPVGHTRGVRGAYLVNAFVSLAPGESEQWQLVANVEQTQRDVVDLKHGLDDPVALAAAIELSVARNSDELARIVAAGDGFQATAMETDCVHHYANTMFNILRGGTFEDGYHVPGKDVADTVQHFNRAVYDRHSEFLRGLPEKIDYPALVAAVEAQNDRQLERLCHEYLPITFGRRHGDPSRPWNHFAIRLRDAAGGGRLLFYEGNWRDIFQNWEALTWSFPEFVENTIAKFVNASTMDGYNPYRITKHGIDWEIQDPDDPWSFIGYWGDHQIIYLLKLTEQSERFHPARLTSLLRRPVFSYANVPYRIRRFESLLEDPKNTVEYDEALAARINDRVERMGADGRLVLDAGSVYLVNLLEKLLVPLLAKLGNLVVDGGIWMNTQRPEWNDANNALVGNGLSMVTLYYLRRYVSFLDRLLEDEHEPFDVSREVCEWLADTREAMQSCLPLPADAPVAADARFRALTALGKAADGYRTRVYERGTFSGKAELAPAAVHAMLENARRLVEHCIRVNRREDGLYHAYNLMKLEDGAVEIDTLYPMLEGQVAALTSGSVAPREAVSLIESLFDSDIFREDQQTFMLYPDRELPAFLEKNRIPDGAVSRIPLIERMLEAGDDRVVCRDVDGRTRFNPRFRNARDLDRALDALVPEYGDAVADARGPLHAVYETVFRHRAFTGRSGGMFGFEGLGCIYWHMVSKLLLAVQENFFAAREAGEDAAVCRRLGELYYRIREGLGFNKSPAEYGAFPTDPYSHTPKHSGARQPGMTGQVKEEVLTRFGELGVRVADGRVSFDPALLRREEFLEEPGRLEYLGIDGEWHDQPVPARALAFTWCQVPVVYRLEDGAEPGVVISRADDEDGRTSTLTLSAADSRDIFRRNGRIRSMTVMIDTERLFPVLR